VPSADVTMCFTIARPRPVPRDERAWSAPRHVALRDALPVVGHGQQRPCAFPEDRHGAAASGAGVAERVRDEVFDHHAQHPRPQRQLDVGARDEDELDLSAFGTRAEPGDRLLRDRQRERAAERDDLASRLELAEEEHVVDQLARLRDLEPCLVDELVDVGLGERCALQQHEHARERSPQLVRDRRGEPGA
jgi:hypothetical protein